MNLITPILAIAVTDELTVAALVLGGIVTLAHGANVIMDFWRKLKGTDKEAPVPQPMIVKPHDEYVHRREFDAHVRDDERMEESLRKEIAEKFEAQNKLRESQNQGLHNHITAKCNDVKTEVTAMEARITSALSADGKVLLDHHALVAALEARVESLESHPPRKGH